MQSYKKRYEGQELEIKRDLRSLGVFPTMEKYGAKDYARFEAYSNEILGGEHAPAVNPAATQGLDELANHLLVAILNKLQTQEAEIHRLRLQVNARESFKQQEELESKNLGLQLLAMLKA